MESRKLRLTIIVAVSVLGGFFLGSYKEFLFQKIAPISSSSSKNIQPASFAEIADQVTPSVVSVVSTRVIDVNPLREGVEIPPNGRPDSEGRRRSLGYGSGFIIDGRGIIVTNEHVIDDSRHVVVRLHNGREYLAKLLGSDHETDVALLKINPRDGLLPVRLGDSDQLRVGDWVMAVGNPYNYEHTVTVGVVSAKDRKIDDNPFERYIQTDAAINYGNSGGPLFNGSGEVVAINSAISTRGRGIGFSIPINLVKDVVKQLEQRGRVVRGYLGLGPESITEEYEKLLHLRSRQGVLVAEVAPDSAAARAGIQRYDVITEIDGTSIPGEDFFRRKIAGTSPGTRIHLRGLRNQREITFDVQVGERQSLKVTPLDPRQLETGERPESKSAPGLGIAVQELTVEHRRLLHMEGLRGGVVIVNVREVGLAAEAGLAPGEVILEMNRSPVRSLVQYQQLLAQSQQDGFLVLLVSPPNGSSRLVTLNLQNR